MEVNEMRRLALLDLKTKGFALDSYWEGSGSWLGCYARPKNKPPYGFDEAYDEYGNLIPKDGQDYTEWFEWNVPELLELQRQYPQ